MHNLCYVFRKVTTTYNLEWGKNQLSKILIIMYRRNIIYNVIAQPTHLGSTIVHHSRQPSNNPIYYLIPKTKMHKYVSWSISYSNIQLCRAKRKKEPLINSNVYSSPRSGIKRLPFSTSSLTTTTSTTPNFKSQHFLGQSILYNSIKKIANLSIRHIAYIIWSIIINCKMGTAVSFFFKKNKGLL